MCAQAPRAAPLHARIGALIQVLRFATGPDGVPLPPLPPAETSLLIAAESYTDVQTSRVFREVKAQQMA